MINYGASGIAVNFHYKMRLISSYQNKLFYNVFTVGVIPNSGTITIIDAAGAVTTTTGTRVKIPSGFSFCILPNNEYTSNTTIYNNFAALSSGDKNILGQQLLKCDIVKDFYVTPDDLSAGEQWLIAEYNYLEFTDLPVTFSFTTIDPTGTNLVILEKYTIAGGYIPPPAATSQSGAGLGNNILYEMNVDHVSGYDAGNESGYIPISNGTMCSGLNAEMISGYSGYEAGIKWENNSGLDAEYIADEFANPYSVGKSTGSIPLSNGSGILNIDLNADLLSGSGTTALEPAVHEHYLDSLTDDVQFKKPLGVNTSHYLTHESFNNWAFTKEKIHDECFFAKNDDLGGKIRIITGEVTLTASLDIITFSPKNTNVFLYKPHVMLQIKDNGTGDYNNYHIKIMAHDVSPSNFRLEYTIYEATAGDGNPFLEQAIEDLTIQYIAIGYADEDIE